MLHNKLYKINILNNDNCIISPSPPLSNPQYLFFLISLLPPALPPSLHPSQRVQSLFGTDIPLSTLLIKPIQRITKYPLLLRVS